MPKAVEAKLAFATHEHCRRIKNGSRKMNTNLEFPDVDSAAAAIRNLTKAKGDAEAQIAECLEQMASEEAMLASLLAQPKTTTNSEYLKAGKKACRLGIKARKLSIVAYQNDIGIYNLQIGDITKRIPEARLDN